MNEKNVRAKQQNDEQKLKTLTVEDLAQVVGGAATTEDGDLKVGGETKYPQREGRYPPPVAGGIGEVGGVFEP